MFSLSEDVVSLVEKIWVFNPAMNCPRLMDVEQTTGAAMCSVLLYTVSKKTGPLTKLSIT